MGEIRGDGVGLGGEGFALVSMAKQKETHCKLEGIEKNDVASFEGH